MNRMILVSLLALVPGAAFSQAPAVPADEVRAEAGQEIGGFDAVRQGLAAEMLLSAEELDAGRRKKAMEALDRALHLSEFGKAAFGLPAEATQPFEEAHKAIKNARHVLQMGRPEEAVRILAAAGSTLQGETIPEVPSAGLTPELADAVEGHYVLNARGHRLGELKDFSGTADRAIAVIGVGGLLSIGETLVEVPLESLLGSESFIVLPVTIPQKEFAARGS